MWMCSLEIIPQAYFGQMCLGSRCLQSVVYLKHVDCVGIVNFDLLYIKTPPILLVLP